MCCPETNISDVGNRQQLLWAGRDRAVGRITNQCNSETGWGRLSQSDPRPGLSASKRAEYGWVMRMDLEWDHGGSRPTSVGPHPGSSTQKKNATLA